MVRRKAFARALKQKIVCHETVGGGRAAFRRSSAEFLPLLGDRALTAIGISGRVGEVIGSYGISMPGS